MRRMTGDQMADRPMREYEAAKCAVFCKTTEVYGGLSNMAAGFPIRINGIPVRTSEALYQACRFPTQPDIQRNILNQKSPMAAKMVGKPHLALTRPDWDSVRVEIMRWCLRAKWFQNRKAFGAVLDSTGTMPIVEFSKRDKYWGAQQVDAGRLVGQNVLGRLLMQLRDEVAGETWAVAEELPPLDIPEFLFLGEPIRPLPVSKRGTIVLKQDNPIEGDTKTLGNPRAAIQKGLWDVDKGDG